MHHRVDESNTKIRTWIPRRLTVLGRSPARADVDGILFEVPANSIPLVFEGSQHFAR